MIKYTSIILWTFHIQGRRIFIIRYISFVCTDTMGIDAILWFSDHISLFILRDVYIGQCRNMKSGRRGPVFSLWIVLKFTPFNYVFILHFYFLFIDYILNRSTILLFELMVLHLDLPEVYLLTCAVVVGRLVGICFLLRHQELHNNSVLISVVLICMSKLSTYKFTYLSPFLL